MEHGNYWMPHGYCFAWEPQVFWPMVIGHGVTFAAYMVLPVALWWYFRNRSVRRGDWLRRHLLFATFVGFCGVGHLILVVNLWRAHYLLEGVWACLTAAVSLWAAVGRCSAAQGPAAGAAPCDRRPGREGVQNLCRGRSQSPGERRGQHQRLRIQR